MARSYVGAGESQAWRNSAATHHRTDLCQNSGVPVKTGPLLVLDTASLYYRSFHAMPSSMTAPDGSPNGAVRGFLGTLARLIEVHRPSGVVAGWDADWRPAWRVALMPTYKTHRLADAGSGAEEADAEEAPDDLGPQVDGIADVLDALGLPRWGAPAHEADDVLASLSVQSDLWPGTAQECIVVSGDRDLVQLITDRVRLLLTVNGGMEAWPLLDPQAANARFGVTPAQYVDMAVLRGDPSDGLPGVAGIGAKTAVSLIAQYGDLDALVAAAHAEPVVRPLTPRIAERLRQAHEELGRARAVTTAVRDLPLPGPVPSTGAWVTDEPALADVAERWGVERQVEQVRRAVVALDD